jgi:hypothetical protein
MMAAQGTPVIGGSGSTLLGRRALPTTRSTPMRCRRAGRPALVRAVLDIKKSSAGNGVAKVDASTLGSEIEHELHYRLAAKQADVANLYKSVAWSVHNRLLETFEATHEYWK